MANIVKNLLVEVDTSTGQLTGRAKLDGGLFTLDATSTANIPFVVQAIPNGGKVFVGLNALQVPVNVMPGPTEGTYKILHGKSLNEVTTSATLS